MLLGALHGKHSSCWHRPLAWQARHRACRGSQAQLRLAAAAEPAGCFSVRMRWTTVVHGITIREPTLQCLHCTAPGEEAIVCPLLFSSLSTAHRAE
jgi:hypothetical protein